MSRLREDAKERAMKHIDLIIPTRNRWEKLQRCLRSIPRVLPQVELNITIICDGDRETAEKLIVSNNGQVGHLVLVAKHSGAVYCRNLVTQCAEDALLYATDDIEFKPGAIEVATESMREHFPDDDGVVGFNQIGKQEFSKAGVALVGQQFLRRHPGKKLFYPKYFHFSCQEIERLALRLGKLHFEEQAMLCHYHPIWNREEMDNTHVEAREHRKDDQKISSERRAKKLIWGDNE